MLRVRVGAWILAVLAFSFACILWFSLHVVDFHQSQQHAPLSSLHRLTAANITTSATAVTTKQNAATLSTPTPLPACRFHMPKSECHISEAVQYWSNPTDCYESPLRKLYGLQAPEAQRRYVVFQPDLGGWNNIRMALEVVILVALVTGRILVLPPDAVLYLLSKNKKWKDNFSNMDDYFNFELLKAQNGIEVISMAQFLALVKEKPVLYLEHNETHPVASVPPLASLAKQPLWDFLEKTCYWRQWSPGKTFLVFGQSDEALDDKSSRYIHHSMNYKRVPVLYNEDSFANKTVVFFAGHDRNRMLTHFYGYLYMKNDAEDRLIKRFVRDRMRYHDQIFCVGGGIVDTLRSGSRGERYVAYHIRRGDFQHKFTQWSAEKIIESTKHLLGNTHQQQSVYISTDESNMTFFEPFNTVFRHVFFLSNFSETHRLQTLDQNHLGMVEQVICASAHVFIGTPLSTFTGYISRLRGYKNRTLPGIYERTYYFMPKQMYQLHKAPHLALPMWPREYVEAFENIEESEK